MTNLLVKICFFVSLFLIFYTFLGYPILVLIISRIERLKYKIKVPKDSGKIYLNPKIAGYNVLNEKFDKDFYPAVSVIIAAYNEEKFIKNKLQNILELDYPADKIEYIFVTDGSTDDTNEIIKSYLENFPNIKLLYKPERKGKLEAIMRAIPISKGEIIVFSDANAYYNKEAIKFLVRHFQFPRVGCVAGEKRVISKNKEKTGEGLYWKYESFLKKLDSELYSVAGAAGEIFAIRKSIISEIPSNVILDDFFISINAALKGYRVVYEPNAQSFEMPSKSFIEDFKRRLRISRGGIQSIFILKDILNIKLYKFFSFQVISHRFLRWTLTPISLPIFYFTNYYLFLNQKEVFFTILFYFQTIVYLLGIIGFLLETFNKKVFIFHLIFSFMLMNFASFISIVTYPFIKKSSIWKKVERDT